MTLNLSFKLILQKNPVGGGLGLPGALVASAAADCALAMG